MKNINTLLESAIEHHKSGNFSSAELLYKEIVKAEPSNVDAHNNLGVVLKAQGRLNEAEACFRMALQLKPSFEAYNNLAILLHAGGRLNEAAENYREALKFKPWASTYNNLGCLLQGQGRLDEAVSLYRQALSLRPDYVEALTNLGLALKGQSLSEALASCMQALSLNPGYAKAHNNMGVVLQDMGRLDEALESYKEAVRLKPDFVEAYYNIGVISQAQCLLSEAEASYRKAIELDPRYAKAYNNLGMALQDKGRFDEAIAGYESAAALEPDYAEANWNRGIWHLLTGNYEKGWQGYEWRWHMPDAVPLGISQPEWDGTPLNGKTILVHTEQGIGDTFQFVRYLPMVKSRGGHVLFECQEGLSGLLAGCRGIDEIVERPCNRDRLHFDLHVPLMSLPRIFGTVVSNIPSDVPYVIPDPALVAYWRDRLSQHGEYLRIGIVWAGNPRHKNDRNRSASLSDFGALGRMEGLKIFSLQKGKQAVDAVSAPRQMGLIDLTPDIRGFSDTAAIIENLDLVISVDTAVVHLAGAMNRPVWTLLPFIAEWRWLLGRDDTPWYPSMRLFRQPSQGDWKGLFARVCDEIEILKPSFVKLSH